MSELARALAPIVTAIALGSFPAAAAEAPTGPATTGCAVYFRPNAPPTIRSDGSFSESIVARVQFADGHSESAPFPYPWIYPAGEQNDPWSQTNLRRGDFVIPVVLPPPGSDRNTFPPLIRYILDHTNANGFTTLTSCDGRSGPRLRVLSSFTVRSAGGVPVSIVDVSPPDAPVAIVKAWAGDIGRPLGDTQNSICIEFRNASSRPLTGVRLTLSALTSAGRVDHVDEALTTQTFAPNDGTLGDLCTAVRWDPTIPVVRVAVAWVRFGDGTTWGTPPYSGSSR